MSADTLALVVAFGVAISLSLLLYLLMAPRLAARARMRRRVELVSGKAAVPAPGREEAQRGGRRRNIQSRIKEAQDAKSTKPSRTVRYRRELRAAGLAISLQRFLLVCTLLGIVGAIAYMAAGYPPVGALPVAVTVGFGLPRFVVRWLGRRRVKRFTQLFADAVDVIVRGIRSGLPVGECLNIIARESAEPVGAVFREIVEAQRLGLNLEQALERAQEQMPTSELKFFNIVLSIQQQTGGNLADTLANLSGILRARKKMQDKVRALSSEARSSAMIIGSLPFLMTALLWLVSPDYIGLLFSEDMGKVMIMGGLAWMGVGIFVMKQMVSFEI